MVAAPLFRAARPSRVNRSVYGLSPGSASSPGTAGFGHLCTAPIHGPGDPRYNEDVRKILETFWRTNLSEEEARLTAVHPPLSHEVPRSRLLDRLLFPIRLGRLYVFSLTQLVKVPRLRLGSPPLRSAASGALRALNVRLRSYGSEQIPPGGALFMWNHSSYLDSLILLASLPVPYRIIHHLDSHRVPVFPRWLEAAGHYSIDRFEDPPAGGDMLAAMEWLEQGHYLLVAPEGSRSWDGRILPLTKAPFRIAIEARQPIVPVVIHGAHRALPRGRMVVRPTEVEVEFLAPISTTGYGPRNQHELKTQVAGAFRAALNEGPPSRKKTHS